MDNKEITSEDILQMPAFAPWHNALSLVKTRTGKELFPEKYRTSMLDIAREKTNVFFKEQPNTPLQEAVVAILGSFQSELSGELLLKITQEIIEKWEKLSKNVHHVERELAVV